MSKVDVDVRVVDNTLVLRVPAWEFTLQLSAAVALTALGILMLVHHMPAEAMFLLAAGAVTSFAAASSHRRRVTLTDSGIDQADTFDPWRFRCEEITAWHWSPFHASVPSKGTVAFKVRSGLKPREVHATFAQGRNGELLREWFTRHIGRDAGRHLRS